MRNNKELVSKACLYCILAFLINYLSSAVVLVCAGKLVAFLTSNFNMTATEINTLSMLAVAVLDLLLILAASLIFIRKVLPPLYEEGEGELWLKKSAFLILPGELVRYLFSLTDLGFVDGSGKFSIVPSCLFELVYLKDPDKYSAVRRLGRFAFVDYVAFSLCYVLYLAVFLVAVFWMCKRVWNKYGKDYADI